MNEDRTTKIVSVNTTKIVAVQCCMLCENSRELPNGMSYSHYPCVCDECKEAIAFLKDFIKSASVTKEMLNEMEEPSKNVHPL